MIQDEGDEPVLSFLFAARAARRLTETVDISEMGVEDLIWKIWLYGLDDAQRSSFVLRAHRSWCVEAGHPDKEVDFAQWHKNRRRRERQEGRKRWQKYCQRMAKQIEEAYCTAG